MMMARPRAQAVCRPGITLTEILIAILILGVGLVSLATLFPIGLLRLRDAARYSRSTYLSQAATADLSSRSLLSSSSFANTLLYTTNPSGFYSPLIQDTPYFGGDWAGAASAGSITTAGAYAGPGGLGIPGSPSVAVASGNGNAAYPPINGPGLPFAYDPLWIFQTANPNGYEARFGAGIGFIRDDSSGGPNPSYPSAHGLPRITNFTPAMLLWSVIPSIFVSPEDVVWQDPTNQKYSIAGNAISIASANGTPAVGSAPSPVVPDLSISPFQQVNDYRYSWMFTGQLINASNQSMFDGNIVILENRQFGISVPPTIPNAPSSPLQAYQVDGETVVEAIFGHSGNINGNGYGIGADRTVLLRWYSSVADPVVKAGDWIADVTYERSQSVVQSRWWGGSTVPVGVVNPNNNGEWDNLPAQRCYWYQVQKVLAAVPDPYLGSAYRSMVVYVNQSLVSRTVLSAAGTPVVINAALIAPSVVNVIPQTIFTR